MRKFLHLTNLIALQEWRNKSTLNSSLVYLVSVIFVCYLSFNLKSSSLGTVTWVTLFWIIQLFIQVNLVTNSFRSESGDQYFYLYHLCRAEEILIARLLFNLIAANSLSILSLFVYAIVMGSESNANYYQLVSGLFLGSTSLISVLTMVSAIASRTSNNAALTAILGFPLVLPSLLMSLKASFNAIDNLDWYASYDEYLTLLSLSLISIALSYILFPYIWKS